MMNAGKNSCGKVIYMGPEKVNETCMKTIHAEMMDRGFTAFAKQSKALDLPRVR
jgi:hypothetical protein